MATAPSSALLRAAPLAPLAAALPLVRPRPFVVTGDVAEPDVEQIFRRINALKEIVESVSEKQATTKIRIYARLAPKGEVSETHQQWLEELRLLNNLVSGAPTNLEELLKLAVALSPEMSIIRDKQRKSCIATAVQEIQCLDQRLFFIQSEQNRLITLLGNSLFSENLQLYKRFTAECEELCRNAKIPLTEKVTLLQSLLDRAYQETEAARKTVVTNKPARGVAAEIQTLHIHLYEFIENTANLFKAALPAQQQNLQLEFIINDTLKKTFDKYRDPESYSLPAKVQRAQVAAAVNPAEIVNYKKSFAELKELRPGLHFKQASWMQKLVIRIKTEDPILVQVRAFEELAKGLQVLDTDVQKRMDAISSGATKARQGCEDLQVECQFYKVILKEIQDALRLKQAELDKLEQTGEIGVAHNYAEGLFMLSRDISRRLEFFQRFTDPNYIDGLATEHKVFTLLNHLVSNNASPRVAPHTQPRETYLLRCISYLFYSAQGVRELPVIPRGLERISTSDYIAKFRGRVIDTLEKMVAYTGRKVFADCPPDTQVWDTIVKFTPFTLPNTRQLPDLVKHYLLKPLVQWLFFGQAASSYRQDIMLYLLQHVATYRDAFNESMRSDPDFRAIIDYYKEIRGVDLLPHSLGNPLTNSLALLQQANSYPKGNYRAILCYAEASLLLSSCDAIVTSLAESESKRAQLEFLQTAKATMQAVQVNHDFYPLQSTHEYNANKENVSQLSETAKRDDGKRPDFNKLLITLLANAFYASTPAMKQEAIALLRKYFAPLTAQSKLPEMAKTKFLMIHLINRVALADKVVPLAPFEKQMMRELAFQYVRDKERERQLREIYGTCDMEVLLYKVVKDEAVGLIIDSIVDEIKTHRRNDKETDETKENQDLQVWKDAMQAYIDWKYAKEAAKAAAKRDSARALGAAFILIGLPKAYKDVIKACLMEVDPSAAK